ncbi:MAG: hypothetical protein HY896_05285 [Deltaproteobacteria bacterium]|nr:hypothetical protein [Deltaproteobacteria bacterium]
MEEHNHHHHDHDHPEGHGGHKPVKLSFKDFKMERAFAFDPAKGEVGVITYTIDEPARISIKVIKAKTRELYLKTIVNWETREAGTHTETWDGRDYEGKIIDLSEAIIMMEGEPLKTYAPGRYSVEGLSDEEIVHGHPHGHSHNLYKDGTNVVPELTVTSVKQGDVLSGVVTIESELADLSKLGYGEEVGYGVRYYLDHTLVEEEFYDKKCEGKFSYKMDTTAYPDGVYTLYVGMCDHHQHATSTGCRIRIKNSV